MSITKTMGWYFHVFVCRHGAAEVLDRYLWAVLQTHADTLRVKKLARELERLIPLAMEVEEDRDDE
ncbi:MAG: hypothetical protein NVS2B14_01260 [Chamaesiphon sp.]